MRKVNIIIIILAILGMMILTGAVSLEASFTDVDGCHHHHHGHHTDDGHEAKTCNKCNGSGKCHMCGGSGVYNGSECNTCSGTGRCFYCGGDGELWD